MTPVTSPFPPAGLYSGGPENPATSGEKIFMEEVRKTGQIACSMVPDAVFRRAPAAAGRIFVVPVSGWTEENQPAFEKFLASGGKVLLYGNSRDLPAELLNRLGLADAKPVTGLAAVHAAGDPEDGMIIHIPPENGLCTLPADPEVEVLAEVIQRCGRRVLASRKGNLLYIDAVSQEKTEKTENIFHAAALLFRMLKKYAGENTAENL